MDNGYGKSRERAEEFGRFVRDEVGSEGWRKRCRVVGLDGRCEAPHYPHSIHERDSGSGEIAASGEMADLGLQAGTLVNAKQQLRKLFSSWARSIFSSAVLAKVSTANYVIVLDHKLTRHTRIAVIGTIEELAASPQTLTLVRSQFETNFFGPVNIIKATLPTMRQKRSGHIIVLTGISSSHPFLHHQFIRRY